MLSWSEVTTRLHASKFFLRELFSLGYISAINDVVSRFLIQSIVE